MALSESSRVARMLVGEFARRYPGEAARSIERLSGAAAARWFDAIPGPQVPAVLERLMPDLGGRALARMPDDAARRALETVDPDRAVTLLAWLTPEARERYRPGRIPPRRASCGPWPSIRSTAPGG